MTIIRLALLLILFLSTKLQAAQVAIIIDDVGYRHTDKQVLQLPPEVTLSFLPFTPLSHELSVRAHQQGHEIMLHLPMQALNGKAMGTGGIKSNMNQRAINNILDKAMRDVPNATGVNNHMGSYVTQLEQPMQWLMQGLKQRGLFFVDSFTTRFTKAMKAADKAKVPNLKRSVFLDNDISQQGLEHQFQQIIKLSKTHDRFIVIAHPYLETIEYLKNNLSRLKQHNIQVTSVAQLLAERYSDAETSQSALLVK
ncbi:divergent polysaccharide deacetylase family protein [Parashewanella curva]|uniref:Divergent polysaccharide deacetylase family protein n=1 Tax=Parashewanella curva TaxID=2338552 RepID=A0A3L8PTK6_9GAMM|nr:divergent polysaccharide deacetylase family protein [Parashewanella curva]RLV58747.1 divergent polysaccharide deacetylase family protein [Parashewanella curva]